MKSLDEVIKAYEQCAKSDWEEGCGDCAYRNEKCGSCKCVRNDDALHYLKEYRKYNDTMCALPDYYEWVHSADNPPLTWDELKQMVGKPVWVEVPQWSEWLLISFIDNDRDEMYLRDKWGNGVSLNIRNNLTWRAYRKEHK